MTKQSNWYECPWSLRCFNQNSVCKTHIKTKANRIQSDEQCHICHLIITKFITSIWLYWWHSICSWIITAAHNTFRNASLSLNEGKLRENCSITHTCVARTLKKNYKIESHWSVHTFTYHWRYLLDNDRNVLVEKLHAHRMNGCTLRIWMRPFTDDLSVFLSLPLSLPFSLSNLLLFCTLLPSYSIDWQPWCLKKLS